MSRNYAAEYKNYHSRPEQRKRRSLRGAARRLMIKKAGERAVKGMDVHHRDRNPANNMMSNLQIMSKAANRSRNS